MSKRETKALRGPTPRHKEGDEVVYIDNDSAPRLIFSGEDILCEDLPVGTRVVYAKPPIEGLNNPGAAIRYAINHPLDADPLYAQLAPGMRVTIAIDDIKQIVHSALAHRIILDPSLWDIKKSENTVIAEISQSVSVPVLKSENE